MPVPTPAHSPRRRASRAARTAGQLLTTLLLLPVLVVSGLTAVPTGASTTRWAEGGGGSAAGEAESLRLVGGSSRVRRALRIAINQKGDPYQYGSAGPNRFDCSGLVYYATHKAGLKRVPRSSSAQARYMDRIKRSKMRPGDFVFFTGSGGVYHVGIFVGWRDGRRAVVHSPRPGSRVHTARIWTDSWFAGTLR